MNTTLPAGKTPGERDFSPIIKAPTVKQAQASNCTQVANMWVPVNETEPQKDARIRFEKFRALQCRIFSNMTVNEQRRDLDKVEEMTMNVTQAGKERSASFVYPFNLNTPSPQASGNHGHKDKRPETGSESCTKKNPSWLWTKVGAFTVCVAVTCAFVLISIGIYKGVAAKCSSTFSRLSWDCKSSHISTTRHLSVQSWYLWWAKIVMTCIICSCCKQIKQDQSSCLCPVLWYLFLILSTRLFLLWGSVQ